MDTMDDFQTDREIYCNQLQQKGRGFPLYVPDPQISLPEEYRQQGVAIGDVGSITPEGIFDFYFNIYLSPDHPINVNHVPQDFVPLPLYSDRDTHHLDYKLGDCVSTFSVHEMKPQFLSGYVQHTL
ncbi:hypothetical protein C8R44DRAFT_701466 [Mycena epipterygia]|nr:hypothetical protein C8R44DRAFT_701466 [Mycena epipterygia]